MSRRTMQNQTMEDLNAEKERIVWYWRLIALASSWMILGGYLILPNTFMIDPQLRFSRSVLSILIVTIMTTGYSFTVLLSFACRNWLFQAESVFLPSLTSSVLGLLTVLWCFASSTRYEWNNAAIVATTLASFSSALYGFLLFLSYRKLNKIRKNTVPLQSWGEQTYYKNYLANMFPSAHSSGDNLLPTEDDLVNQRLALLLRKNDPGPSPEAWQSTFRIDLPEDRSHEVAGHEIAIHQIHPTGHMQEFPSQARMQSPPHQQRSAWDRMTGRGRSGNLSVDDARGRGNIRLGSNSSRPISREDRERRRQEIENGL